MLVVLTVMAVTILGAFSMQPVDALTFDTDKENVQLTEAQKKEIAKLEKDILEKKKEVISKYVQYGVMTEEKGEKVISRLEERYKKLEQNEFVPKWHKCKKKHSH
ncbi:MAG: YckD family protein [Bacillota bacterium]